MNRWWIYQKERFPVVAHGSLIGAFSSCAVAYAAILTNTEVSLPAFAAAFVTCFLYFLQLRIADEFKDADEDAQFRPYRPVPRGLIRLAELRLVFIAAAVIQLIVTLLLHPPLALFLFIGWTYLALMSVEFFARDWLIQRPITYLWTHMMIMPIVDFHATACQWMPALNGQSKPLGGLIFFLGASFCNGLVIELGRKLRQPIDEENGVPTYSKLWGLPRASTIWLTCLVATAILAILAATKINAVHIVAPTLGSLLLVALVLRTKSSHLAGKHFEVFSGIWTLALYLSLGLIPLLLSL